MRSPGAASRSWHALSITDALAALGVTPGGLDSGEAAHRLRSTGPNELPEARRVSAFAVLIRQFQNVLVIILIIGAGLSVAMGHITESIVIGVIVVFAAVLGFIQEFRAEKAMEALRQLAAPTAEVIRDGQPVRILSRELVPGDIVILHPGDRIPGDGRLLEAVNLRTEEASLTGESNPAQKNAAVILPNGVAPADRINMVFSGTSVAAGRGRALITSTGIETEFGKIARMLQSVAEVRTPLQENLDRTGKSLARAALAVVGLIVVLGLLRGQPLLDMVLFGIALAVAVVPEALTAVVTISLAIGVERMAKRHVLVRRLPSVETLGSVAVIASDKTGTLTKDEMTVRTIFAAGQTIDVSGSGYEVSGKFSRDGRPLDDAPGLVELLRAGVLASDAVLREGEGGGIHGDPTEGALVVAAAKAGIFRREVEDKHPRADEIPFTSESRRMTTLHNAGGRLTAFAKGAPEVILASCTQWLTADGPAPLDEASRSVINQAARTMASQALRVLGVATKADVSRDDAEEGMLFLGLAGMIDPPRSEVKEAIGLCRSAGILPIMITGDHPATAEAIARELGILEEGRILTGTDLDALSDEQFEKIVETVHVYARVSPEHKLRVVSAFQKKGRTIAMTGDGVNDAPALKKADIGIAMGVTGTDVTKEAAAMTLTDDNFASIVAAVEEGRGVFGNIKKYLMYLLSSNIGEITLMAGASIFGLPLPLSAVQILYVNLATDGLPALALALDPPDDGVMKRPPRDPRRGIFSKAVVVLLAAGGFWSALVNAVLFTWALASGRSMQEAMTMTFVSLVLIQFFKAYNYRSDIDTLFKRPFANRWLNLAIAWELALLVAVIYIPFFQRALGTYSLTFQDWALIVLTAASIVPVLEIMKAFRRRGVPGSDGVLR